MTAKRRDFLRSALLVAASAKSSFPSQAPQKIGIPGPYRGRVVTVRHPGCIVSNAYQAGPVEQMLHKGMTELTGAPGWPDAWRVLFEPGDVVGIKMSPVGGKRICSDPLVLHQVIDGLKEAGVRPRDIIVFSRYHQELLDCGMPAWLPPEVRLGWAAEAYDDIQLDMAGYDPGHFLDLTVCQPGQNISDDHVRRSYVAQVVTRQINKLVNLPVLKQHHTSGVTIALKNISCGLVNNVCRIHQKETLNVSGVFIPSVVNLKPIREKTVLHIVDGVKALYSGGPGGNPKYIWEHKAMYFATDPVALDKVGWRAIDAKRAQMGLAPLALAKPDADNHRLNCQVEHIEIAGAIGLGEFDDSKIQLKEFDLS